MYSTKHAGLSHTPAVGQQLADQPAPESHSNPCVMSLNATQTENKLQVRGSIYQLTLANYYAIECFSIAMCTD